VSRARLLLAAGFVLALILVAWFIRTGRWKQRRLALLSCAALAGLLLLSRRVGWAELAILAGLVLVPFILLPSSGGKR
jgi:hypothetical protein